MLKILALIDSVGVSSWLDGGWGVDALLKRESRLHVDIDLVIALEDAQKLVDRLTEQGFVRTRGRPPTCFVLSDSAHREVDVHPVTFTDTGDGLYLMENGRYWTYPAAGFSGAGEIDGCQVKCLSAEAQMLCHTGYQLDAEDVREMLALHEAYGVPLSDQCIRAQRELQIGR